MIIKKTFQALFFSIAAMCLSLSSANATIITAAFNSNSYQTFNIDVTTASNVNFQFLSGYYDPIFQLFDAAGNHIITNDDTFTSLYSRLTQNLAAGNYTLLVDYFVGGLDALPGSTFSFTDGFNDGTYYIGGSATLGSVTSYLDGLGYVALSGTPFSLSLTNAAISGDVPEPESMALFGLALVVMMMARRRKSNVG